MSAEAVVYLCLFGFLYFLPALVANHRRHHNQAAIFTLNLLGGWTAIGWIAAFVWAMTRKLP
jgi:Superinfection immunity protein